MALWTGFSKSQWKELSLFHVTHLMVLFFIPTHIWKLSTEEKGNIQLWKKVNQKVNLRRRPTRHPYFKGQIFKKKKKSKN